jgi:hypothetical protein
MMSQFEGSMPKNIVICSDGTGDRSTEETQRMVRAAPSVQ